MIASAVKTPKGYVPLLKGKMFGSHRTGPQKTMRLGGVYASREWAVNAAKEHIEREAKRKDEWAKMVARNKAI